jgi:formate-dependent nitrite reductase cytochrome c552 subunit
MSQIFHRSTNTIARVSIALALLLAAGSLWFFAVMQRSPSFSHVGQHRDQVVPFSHAHHVGDEGFDCRYCHTSVETSNFAGIPPTKTCMNCHSEIWANAPMLEPVRQSFVSGSSLVWMRANDLPDYVYFDHSIHINKGVGCDDCHGPVDRMPLMYAQNTLLMEWCLECHRAPEKFLRPRDQVFNMRYAKPSRFRPVTVDGSWFTDQLVLGAYLKTKYRLRSERDITSCSTCHR